MFLLARMNTSRGSSAHAGGRATTRESARAMASSRRMRVTSVQGSSHDSYSRWYGCEKRMDSRANRLSHRASAKRTAQASNMTKGKQLQDGVHIKLPSGVTRESLAKMTPEEIKEKGAWPKGFLPLPHPNHPEGGMVFPKFHIDEVKKQEDRDLARFDLDYDIPDHFLPEFPPPMYLTTRPDLGDVSKKKLVTIDNYYELFKD